MAVTVRDLLLDSLRRIGAEGLARPEVDCCCGLDELGVCERIALDACVAAKRTEPPDWAREEGHDRWFEPI